MENAQNNLAFLTFNKLGGWQEQHALEEEVIAQRKACKKNAERVNLEPQPVN